MARCTMHSPISRSRLNSEHLLASGPGVRGRVPVLDAQIRQAEGLGSKAQVRTRRTWVRVEGTSYAQVCLQPQPLNPLSAGCGEDRGVWSDPLPDRLTLDPKLCGSTSDHD